MPGYNDRQDVGTKYPPLIIFINTWSRDGRCAFLTQNELSRIVLDITYDNMYEF